MKIIKFYTTKATDTCVTCCGRGTVWEDGQFTPCPTCGGQGIVEY